MDWLSLFSLATGLGVIAAYALLGACWLIWKTEGGTQVFGRELAFTTLLCTVAALAVVSIWTPLAQSRIAARWFAWPDLVRLGWLPGIAVVACVGLMRSLWGRRDWAPFAWAIVLFAAALGGLAASLWPYAVPGTMTIWQASSTHRTQTIVAGALVIIVPIVLAYMALGYWTFRGKTDGAAS
jgi:cytochrome d ubiquinol oxidase subunit II